VKIINRILNRLGYVKAERLSHASGALSDINIIITSCVGKAETRPQKVDEVCSSVLQRILCSADVVRQKPSWYIHDWEKELWEKYLSGELKACASDNPTIEEAKRYSTI